MRFGKAWYVAPEGRAGGLALWWKSEILVNIVSGSKHVVHTKIEAAGMRFPEYISFIYGPL